MAGPNVTTTVRIVGDDRASGVIDSIAATMRKLASGAQHVAANAEGAADKAGDMERGFRGVKDILGSVGGEQLQSITDKFGGIEAIIKGFGPKLGVIGLTIAGIGAGAAYWYEQTEKTRKAALDIQIQAIQASKGDIEAQARRLGVSAELLGKKREELTVEGVIAEAKDRANKIDELRVQILEKQKEGQTEGTAALERQIAATRELLALDDDRLSRAKRLAEINREHAAVDAKNTREEVENQRRINGILDNKARLNAQAADLGEKRRLLDEREGRLRDLVTHKYRDQLYVQTELLDVARQQADLDARERANANEGRAIADAARAKAEAANAAAAARRKARAAEAAKFDDELAAHRRDLDARATEFANAAFQAERQMRAEREADEARVRAAAIAAAATPEDSFVLKMLDLEIQKRQQLEFAKEQFAGNDEARKLREKAIIAEIDVKKAAVHNAERDRLRQAQVAWGDATAKRIADAQKQREESRAQRDQEIQGALAVASAVVGASEQMGASQRQVAGLRALIAGVDAIRLAYEQQYANAALAAIAAVQYGYIASGSGLGSGGGAGAASTASAGTVEAGSEKRALAGGGGGGNVIINYNKSFHGSAQENAKGIASTLKSLKSTGYSSYKGA